MRCDERGHPSPVHRFMASPGSGVASCPQICSAQPTDTRGAAMILVNHRIEEGR